MVMLYELDQDPKRENLTTTKIGAILCTHLLCIPIDYNRNGNFLKI